jgi:hypothetical protein
MFSGSCPTSKLYDKIIKMPSRSHETIPLTFKLASKNSKTVLPFLPRFICKKWNTCSCFLKECTASTLFNSLIFQSELR